MIVLYTMLGVIGVSLLSLLGIVFFLFDERDVRAYILYFVSLSTGALLGDVFIHIVPEMASKASFASDLYVLLFGILFSFMLEKLIHWRHCHMLPSGTHHHPMGIVNMFGESVHNFIDGLVIAAGFVAGIPIGISTTLAVMIHEIPHEVGNVAILLHSGYPRRQAIAFNALSAAASVIGAAFVLATAASSEAISGAMLPFAAGNLLYIAGSDLIPELHKESKLLQSFGQLACIVVGMGLMYVVKVLQG